MTDPGLPHFPALFEPLPDDLPARARRIVDLVEVLWRALEIHPCKDDESPQAAKLYAAFLILQELVALGAIERADVVAGDHFVVTAVGVGVVRDDGTITPPDVPPAPG